MRVLLVIFLFFSQLSFFGQSLFDGYEIEETNIYYQDSSTGKIIYGNYQPSAIISLDDGSVIIGSEFDIIFPSKWDSNMIVDSSYFAYMQFWLDNWHISSGSVIKLNDKLEKEWELIFPDERVEKVLKTNDKKIFVIGEELPTKRFWIAQINYNGEILWKKTYKYKNVVRIDDAKIDNANDLYILVDSEHLRLISRGKRNGKRGISFFRNTSRNANIAVIKVSSEGKVKWRTSLENTKGFSRFGYKIIIGDSSIFASVLLGGFGIKDCKENGNDCRSTSVLNKNGKLLDSFFSNERELLFEHNGLLAITSTSYDTLKLFLNEVHIDTLILNDVGLSRIVSATPLKDGFLVFGHTMDGSLELVIKLSENLKFENYWIYHRSEICGSVGAAELPDGSIILLGDCRDRNVVNDEFSPSFINLLKISNTKYSNQRDQIHE